MRGMFGYEREKGGNKPCDKETQCDTGEGFDDKSLVCMKTRNYDREDNLSETPEFFIT